MSLTIYLDLDETLIHSIPGRPGMGTGKRKKIMLGDGETYHTFERPLAGHIIAACREIAPTRILTTSTREYALAINESFSFLFTPQDIIGRDDYTAEVQTAYGGKDNMLLAVNTDKTGALIDNLGPETPQTYSKIKFLGITQDRFFKIREYPGGKDPEKFEKAEWPQILKALKGLAND